MKIMRAPILGTIAAAFLALACIGAARANPSMLKTFDFAHPGFIHKHDFATVRVVIQISQNNPHRWALAMNNAQNIANYFGNQKAQIVIVAYGPGLHMLLAGSPAAKRIAALDSEGIEFDACHNTMEGMARSLGHMPTLVPQAVIVPAGVVRILQLESHGFDYIKP